LELTWRTAGLYDG